ncbi:hypothetical protein DN536_40175, partial [Burkholderia multivorans]
MIAGDAENFSPPLVADTTFLEQYGIDPEALPATVELPGHQTGTATVIGSVRGYPDAEAGEIYVLHGQEQKFGPDVTAPTDYEMWLPPDVAKQLSKQVETDLKRQLPGVGVETMRSDMASDIGDALGPVKNVLLFISVLILFMGMLGLVN